MEEIIILDEKDIVEAIENYQCCTNRDVTCISMNPNTAHMLLDLHFSDPPKITSGMIGRYHGIPMRCDYSMEDHVIRLEGED